MRYKEVLGFCLLIAWIQGYSQPKTMSVSELFRRIEASRDSVFMLENAVISVNTVADKRFVLYDSDSLINANVPLSDTLFINKAVVFRNVTFSNAVGFYKIVFQKRVQWEGTGFQFLKLSGCRFLKEFVFEKPVVKDGFYFEKCVFKGDVTWSEFPEEAGWFRVNRCTFYGDFINSDHENTSFQLVPENCDFHGSNFFRPSEKGYFVSFRNCRFTPLPSAKVRLYNDLLCFRHFNGRIEMINCKLKALSDKDVADFSQMNSESVFLSNVEFDVFFYAIYSNFKNFKVVGSTFKRRIEFRDFSFNVNHTSLNFSQIAHQVVIKKDLWSEYLKSGQPYIPYLAKTDNELSDEYNFKELVAVYSQLLNIYKFRGDQVSYNECYLEMKDIQTRKAAFDFRQQKNLPNLFSWKLNEFMGFFCDYGTNPARALVVSFYVILFFALLYVVFPSEEDNLSRHRITAFFSNALLYFQSGSRPPPKTSLADIQELENLHQSLLVSQNRIPKILSWLGNPLFKLMLLYNRFSRWTYQHTNLIQLPWQEQSHVRKLVLGLLVAGYFVGFFLFGLFMRLLNALALSLNVFVTLGYGEIPAKGFMRYLAVVEGVSGWFLLSIFSVSLIGQILS